MKTLENFKLKELHNPHAVKGGADGKGTKETASRSQGKPQLL